jgi:hypothetical protein
MHIPKKLEQVIGQMFPNDPHRCPMGKYLYGRNRMYTFYKWIHIRDKAEKAEAGFSMSKFE